MEDKTFDFAPREANVLSLFHARTPVDPQPLLHNV